MKKILKSVGLLCAAAPLMIFGATPDAATNANAKPGLDSLFADAVVAKGKGVSVKRSQLDEAMIGVKSSAAAQGQTIPPEQLTAMEQQFLQQLIQVQLLNSHATDADKASGKEVAEKRFTEIKARAGSDEALDRRLKVMGFTRDLLMSKLAEEGTADSVLKRELKPNVSEDDVKKFYDEHAAKFEQPEMVRAAHVLLMTQDPHTGTELPAEQKAAKKKQAEDVLKRAKSGDDFAKLAKDYSEDPGSKDKGGEYTFPRGQMVPEFETTAFSLKTNEVSDIVTTRFGYHIIKLYDRIPAKKAALDDEVVFMPAGYVMIKNGWKGPAEAMEQAAKLSSVIRQKLEADQMQEKAPEFLKKLQKDANVEITDDSLKPAAEPAGEMLAPAAGTNSAAGKK